VSNREAESANLDFARRYIEAIEGGATGDALAAFFTPDVVITEFPNRFSPNGRTSDLPTALAAADRGRQLMRDQRYEIVSATAMDDRVVLELDWTGVVTVPLGSLPAGGRMRDHAAIVLEFRDGKIAVQRHYDCFDPF
jgi:ketosteroid isomerase-like protein